MKQRIEYFDCLRGLCMLLVVYGHISTEMAPGISSSYSVLWLLYLPLFFFISGFFATFSHTITKRSALQKLHTKLRFQLLPTFCMWILFLATFHIPLIDSITQETKSGYWFVWVAIQYYVCYIAFHFFVERNINSRYTLNAILVLIAIASQLAVGPVAHANIFVLKVLSTYNFLLYLPFFIAGLLVKTNFQTFRRVLHNPFATGILILVFLGLFFVPSTLFSFGKLDGLINTYLYPAQRICGLLILVRLFAFFSTLFSKATPIGMGLSLIGRYTLEIYLLHYFFLVSLNLSLVNHLNGWSTLNQIWGIQVIVYGTIAILICLSCILVAKAMLICPPLYRLFLGRCEKGRA